MKFTLRSHCRLLSNVLALAFAITALVWTTPTSAQGVICDTGCVAHGSLTLVTRRDRVLGEEFLTKLKDENSREAKNSASGPGERTTDPWLVSEQMPKRLLLAKQLVVDGQIELGLEIAAPGLNEVNVQSISFLSVLREKRPEVADQRFAMLLTRAELDPSADANTVSGLSSYVLTPGFYVTYSPEGGSRWTQPDKTAPVPNVPAALRNRFFQTAGNILLRPSPPPNQDFSSAGRLGKSMVITRLLPYFDREAPETAAAFRRATDCVAG